MSDNEPKWRYIVLADPKSGSFTVVDKHTGEHLMKTFDAGSAKHYRDVAEQGHQREQERLAALARASGRPL